MNQITLLLDDATAARYRAAAEIFDRPIEHLAELAVAEAAHAIFATMPEHDPAQGAGVMHLGHLPREAL